MTEGTEIPESGAEEKAPEKETREAPEKESRIEAPEKEAREAPEKEAPAEAPEKEAREVEARTEETREAPEAAKRVEQATSDPEALVAREGDYELSEKIEKAVVEVIEGASAQQATDTDPAAIIDSNDSPRVPEVAEKNDQVAIGTWPTPEKPELGGRPGDGVMIDTVPLPEKPVPEEMVKVEGGGEHDPAAIIDSNDSPKDPEVPEKDDRVAIGTWPTPDRPEPGGRPGDGVMIDTVPLPEKPADGGADPGSPHGDVMIDTVPLPEKPLPEEMVKGEGRGKLDPAAIIDSNDRPRVKNDPAAIIDSNESPTAMSGQVAIIDSNDDPSKINGRDKGSQAASDQSNSGGRLTDRGLPDASGSDGQDASRGIQDIAWEGQQDGGDVCGPPGDEEGDMSGSMGSSENTPPLPSLDPNNDQNDSDTGIEGTDFNQEKLEELNKLLENYQDTATALQEDIERTKEVFLDWQDSDMNIKLIDYSVANKQPDGSYKILKQEGTFTKGATELLILNMVQNYAQIKADIEHLKLFINNLSWEPTEPTPSNGETFQSTAYTAMESFEGRITDEGSAMGDGEIEGSSMGTSENTPPLPSLDPNDVHKDYDTGNEPSAGDTGWSVNGPEVAFAEAVKEYEKGGSNEDEEESVFQRTNAAVGTSEEVVEAAIIDSNDSPTEKGDGEVDQSGTTSSEFADPYELKEGRERKDDSVTPEEAAAEAVKTAQAAAAIAERAAAAAEAEVAVQRPQENANKSQAGREEAQEEHAAFAAAAEDQKAAAGADKAAVVKKPGGKRR